MKVVIQWLFDGWEIDEIRGLSIILTTITLIFGIATFLIEKAISAKDTNNKNAKEWLLNIIIKPELDKINSFFSNTITEINKKTSEIESVSEYDDEGEIKITTVFCEKQSEASTKVKNNCQEFKDSFIRLIEEYDSIKGKKLIIVVDELRDNLINSVGSLDKQFIFQDFTQKVNYFRAKFFFELYKYTNPKRRSLFYLVKNVFSKLKRKN